MRKEQFIQELEILLQDLPAGEREEALQYYRDYFDDAGPENEEKVLKELGSPEQVARTMREGTADAVGPDEKNGKKQINGWKIATLVLLCILAAPVAVPLLLGAAGVLVGLLAGIFGVIVAIAAVGVTLLAVGVVLIGVGVAKVFMLPAAGAVVLGTGLIMLSVGILAAMLIIWAAAKIIPALIRGIVKLVQLPFRKRKAAKAQEGKTI